MDRLLLMDTQLGPGPGPGPGESGLCCLSGPQHKTHRALSVENDGGVLSSDTVRDPHLTSVLWCVCHVPPPLCPHTDS